MILMLLSLERFASDPATGGAADGIYELGTGVLSAQRVGAGDLANGDYSYATGRNNTADGDFASALGDTNYAIGDYSFAGGRENVVSGEASTAFGEGNNIDGEHSFAAGGVNSVSGNFSGAVGHNITVGASNSFGVGSNHLLLASNGFASGDSNIITDSNSVAMGATNEVSGRWAGAFGLSNNVTGEGAFTFGQYNLAGGRGASAHGRYAAATSDSEQAYASGYFNQVGDAQERNFYLMCETSDASPKLMEVGQTSAVPTLPVPSNGTWNCNVQLVGRYLAGSGGALGDTICYNFRFACDQSVGFVKILNPSVITEVFDGGGAIAAGWSASIIPNGGDIAVQVIGPNNASVRWFAVLRVSQLVIS